MAKARSPHMDQISGTIRRTKRDPQITIKTDTRGNIVIQDFPKPTDAKTEAQLQWRDRYRQGVAVWNALTDEQKATYTTDPTITNFNNFMREWLLKVGFKGYILDDFADGLYQNRKTFNEIPPDEGLEPPTSEYTTETRPEWTVESGTWDASAGYVSGTPPSKAPGNLSTPSNFMTGTWEYKTRIPQVNTYSRFIPIFIDADNLYDIELSSRSAESWVKFRKCVAGSWTDLISGTWTIDTDWHTITLMRDAAGNFELFFDGVSQGTCTDTSHTSTSVIKLQTEGDPSDFDDIKVY